jgi:hypothetical protein
LVDYKPSRNNATNRSCFSPELKMTLDSAVVFTGGMPG